MNDDNIYHMRSPGHESEFVQVVASAGLGRVGYARIASSDAHTPPSYRVIVEATNDYIAEIFALALPNWTACEFQESRLNIKCLSLLIEHCDEDDKRLENTLRLALTLIMSTASSLYVAHNAGPLERRLLEECGELTGFTGKREEVAKERERLIQACRQEKIPMWHLAHTWSLLGLRRRAPVKKPTATT